MDTVTFAIWKFKNFEGKLEGFRSSEFLSSKIEHGLECYEIKYDPKTEMATIQDLAENTMGHVPFSQLEDELKRLGLYKERDHDRHSSSYPPQNS